MTKVAIIGAGPWARDFWNMLELPKTAEIKGKDGKMHTTAMGLKTDGSLWFWGLGYSGDFGNNQGSPGGVAVGVSSPIQLPGTWAFGGFSRAIQKKADGTWWGWAHLFCAGQGRK